MPRQRAHLPHVHLEGISLPALNPRPYAMAFRPVAMRFQACYTNFGPLLHFFSL